MNASPETIAAKSLGNAELLRLARGGNMIEAIKRYRGLAGSGLKESQDAADRLEGSAWHSRDHA